MKRIFFLFLPVVFLSCKKDPPADNTPVFEIRWTTHSTNVIQKTYIDGALTDTKTDTYNNLDKEVWEFKQNGSLIRFDEQDNQIGSTSYQKKGDSVFIQSGDIFPDDQKGLILNFTKVDLTILLVNAEATAPNRVDSSFTKMNFYNPTQN